MGSVNRILRGRETFFTTNSRKSTSTSSCLAWMPQFLVRRRNSEALSTRMIGGYVSCWKKSARTNEVKAMMAVMYSVQRHPRYEVVMNPPMKGASKGPCCSLEMNIGCKAIALGTVTCHEDGGTEDRHSQTTKLVAEHVGEDGGDDGKGA